MADDLTITKQLIIPGRWLRMSVSRSGGPGGQHVNTTDTKVHLFFDLDGCDVLWSAVKTRIREKRPNSVSQAGELQIVSDRSRSRHMNLEDARKRLAELIRSCLQAPKKRRLTKPTRGSQKRRVESKKRRSSVKKNRGKVRHD